MLTVKFWSRKRASSTIEPWRPATHNDLLLTSTHQLGDRCTFGPGQCLSQKPKRFFASFIRAKVIHALEVDGIYFSDRYKFLEVDASVRFRFQRVKLLLRE